MAEAADQLLKALDSLDESPEFCVSGSVPPVLPGLEATGVGPVGVPISPTTAKQLIKQASQAPYGRGEETIVDTGVRRVWQIEPKNFTLHNAEWDSLIAGLVEKVKTEFGIKGRVNAHLYKLLIYEKGSFFAPHRDSEKVDGMFATMVVGLPSKHEGGKLIVTHDRQSKEIDFAGPQAEYKIQYAAFYTDCRHEIKPVTKGYRVCLVYNLALAQEKRQPEAPRHGGKVEQIAGLLAKVFAIDSRTKIAIPLKHEYTEAGLSLDMLKGADRSRVDVLRKAAEQANYHFYLSLMIYHQEGAPDEETVRYTGRWGDSIDEDTAEMGEVYEEELALDHWIDAEGRPQKFGKMELSEEEILSETAFEDFPFKQEVREATGNEGATVERWYRKTVVVIWPLDRYFRILARQGQDSAVPALEKLVAQAKDPSSDEGCRTFAREIIGNWKTPPHGRSDSPNTASAVMLKQLEQIADPALVKQFIHDVLPKDYSGTEGEALCRLGNLLDWDLAFAERLTRFIALQLPDSPTANLPATVLIVEGLCCSPGKMTAPRKAVCRAVAEAIEPLIRKWDTGKETYFWYRKEGREGIIESLTRALSAIDEGEVLERFLSHALADTKHYNLQTVLIPAVKKLYDSTTKKSVVVKCRQQLLRHCMAELERLTEKPVDAPTNWAQDVTLGCKCADCQELQRFLHHPLERSHYFRIGKQRRQHLHRQIDSHHCDMTHVTDHTGSPQTLVCTKTRASYERKQAEFKTNVQLLMELRALMRPKKKK